MVVIHKIRLKADVPTNQFESWVCEKDYVTCNELPSLISFAVFKVPNPEEMGFHYFEVINIKSLAEFNEDQKKPQFHALEDAFGKMADVVEEVSGDMIMPGFKFPTA